MIFLSGCSGFLYYPSRTLYYPPEKFGIKAEEVFFQSKAGPKLFGWYFETKKKPKGTILFYHGNGENMSSHYISVAWLIDQGFNLFAFDYQGYGRSEGNPSPHGTVQDGEAALEWAHNHSPSMPIIVLAQSLGGAVALRNVIDLKDKYPIRLLAVDSTFASYKKVGRYVLKRAWFTWPFQWLPWIVLSDAYAPDGEIDKISPVPLLVIHGDKDQVVDYELGQEVFAQAKEPKEFWTIPEGMHTDIFTRQDISYRKKFVEKIESVLK